MASVQVNFSKNTGKMRPLHGIGNAPITLDMRLIEYLREAGIPFSRLHDTGGMFGMNVFVDIENIFRDFDADVNDPASYDFAFTDLLLTKIREQGTQIIYRLGATIENAHYIRPYRIFPPKDSAKWAEICAHIIAHYNEGWADGFRLDIRYWEIWNEPDNEPEIADNPMWKGTKEQYFELYEKTANLLKSKWSELKIGGYASCGFYAACEGADSKNANVSPRTQYFLDFAEAFFDYITDPAHPAPIDFFSWHSYADRESNIRMAEYAHNLLERYGLGGTEHMLNEWNPGIAHRGTLRDAANILDMIVHMHARTDVSIMTYYDGQAHTDYCGLFDPLRHVPFKAYYALKAFNALHQLGTAVECGARGVSALAAKGEYGQAILLVNPDSGRKICKLKGIEGQWQISRIDARHNLEKCGAVSADENGAKIAVGGYGIALMTKIL